MSSQDQKEFPINPSPRVTPETPVDHDQSKARADANADSFPASDPLSPSISADAAVFDGTDVESAAGPNAGVEQAGTAPPEQIDPGADGKLVI